MAATAVDAPSRVGHVSQARLFGEGSVLTRQLREQRQTQEHAAAAPQPDTELPQAPAQITWPELWDARTTAGFVGMDLGQQASRHKSMQLWWPSPGTSRRTQQPQKRKHARLLHYSAVMARTLQRSGAGQSRDHTEAGTGQAAATTQPAAAPTTLTVTQPGELFGPQAKRQRRAQPQLQNARSGSSSTSAAAWVCCNRLMQEDMPSSQQQQQQQGPVVCGTSNAATAWSCQQCGAARWDGPGGQQQHRIMAALQTADMDATDISQVAKRVLAESGSVAGLGLAPPCADMQAEVQAVLQAQQAAAGGGSTARCRGGDAGHEPSVCVQPGAAAADDELHLLDQHGCLPQAHGVFTNLLTWLQQQQQPQEEGSAPNTSVRLQSAAAAAAALAPGLLAGVLQQQRGVPTVKLGRGALLSWVSDCFEEAASAAAAAQANSAPLQSQQQQQQPLQAGGRQPCTALQRPLPLHTLLALCDRPGASLRQQLADLAAAAVAACGWRLPRITRSYTLEGEELMVQEVAPEEWLWARCSADSSTTRALPARDRGQQRQGQQEAARDDGDDDDDDVGDLCVVECLQSQDWDEVVFVRRRVIQLLSAWHASLAAQLAAAAGGADLELQLPDLQQPSAAAPRKWDKQMRQLLGLQVQQVTRGWGVAPVFALRQELVGAHTRTTSTAGQPLVGRSAEANRSGQRKRQQGTQQQRRQGGRRQAGRQTGEPPSSGPSLTRAAAVSGAGNGAAAAAAAGDGGGGHRRSSSMSAASSGGAGAVRGDIRSRNRSRSRSRQADEQQPSDDDDDSSGGGSSPVVVRRRQGRRGTVNTSVSSSGDSRRRSASASLQWGQGPHGADADDDNGAELAAWLDSVDDLLLLLPPAAGGGWQPTARSQWRAVGGGAAAGGDPCTSHGQGGAGGNSTCVLRDQLPAGMHAVLAQAASSGVAAHVLQRAAARLAQLAEG